MVTLMPPSAQGYRLLSQPVPPVEASDVVETCEASGDHARSCPQWTLNRRLRTLLYLMSALLLLSLLTISLLIWKLTISPTSDQRDPVAPAMESFRTPLGRDVRYMSTNHSFDGLWDAYLKDSLGEFATPEDIWERAEFSLFHQLRCLARFRLAIQRASEGHNVGVDFRDDHWGHCLDYMRRIVLCNADDTIERSRWTWQFPNGTVYQGIEGAEEGRTCRPLQPMCDILIEKGVTRSCVAELDATLHPWPDIDSKEMTTG